MRSLGWTLIQLDLCSYKKRILGQTHSREDLVKIQGKEPPISQEERPQKKKINPGDVLTSDF